MEAPDQSLSAMVKRKADVSLDEWLMSRVNAPEPQLVVEVAAKEGIAAVEDSTTIEVQSAATVEPVTEDNVDVAASEHDTSDWFWSLLEHLGYELW